MERYSFKLIEKKWQIFFEKKKKFIEIKKIQNFIV